MCMLAGEPKKFAGCSRHRILLAGTDCRRLDFAVQFFRRSLRETMPVGWIVEPRAGTGRGHIDACDLVLCLGRAVPPDP